MGEIDGARFPGGRLSLWQPACDMGWRIVCRVASADGVFGTLDPVVHIFDEWFREVLVDCIWCAKWPLGKAEAAEVAELG